MKILVCIACFGTNNDKYLAHLIREYLGMTYDIDINVLSNIPRDLGPRVKVVVGLPTRDPWSLPFGHKRIFAEQLEKYDLFIYSEDDILVTERNIAAFLRATSVLPGGEIAGFLRTEMGPEGKRFFPDVHAHYHWEPSSVRSRSEYTVATFTNEHSGCYLLTQQQLRRAIEAGGFLVEPHEGRLDLLVSAATDPYTRCGFKKVVCISHLEDFLTPHLSNKYAGRMGLEEADFQLQVQALMQFQRDSQPRGVLFDPEARTYHSRWSKSYYEPRRDQILSLIPDGVRSVLSLGCGWGAMEASLVEKGVRVVGAPMDSVIGVCAAARGVEIVSGDFDEVKKTLHGERFDCLLLSNVLHLIADPIPVLSGFIEYLSADGLVVASVPNLPLLPAFCRIARYPRRYKGLVNYESTRMHLTRPSIIRRWFRHSNLRLDQTVRILPERWQKIDRLTSGMARGFMASELIVTARRK